MWRLITGCSQSILPVESPMCKNDLVIKAVECSQCSLSMDRMDIFLQLLKTKLVAFKYLSPVWGGFGVVPVPHFCRGWGLNNHGFCLKHIFPAQNKKTLKCRYHRTNVWKILAKPTHSQATCERRSYPHALITPWKPKTLLETIKHRYFCEQWYLWGELALGKKW